MPAPFSTKPVGAPDAGVFTVGRDDAARFGLPGSPVQAPGGAPAIVPDFPYMDYIAAIKPDGLIFLGPLNEVAGTTAIDYSGNDNDGTYRNASMLNQGEFPTGEPTPLWVPASSDYLSLPAGFLSQFNLQEAVVLITARVRASSVWSDATTRNLVEIQRDGSNRLYIRRGTSNNQLQFTQIAAGTSKVVLTSLTTTDWFQAVIKVSKSSGASGESKGFVNGAQVGTTQTSLGTVAGAANFAVLGAQNTAGAAVWDGYEGYVAIWSGAGNLPTDAEIAGIWNYLWLQRVLATEPSALWLLSDASSSSAAVDQANGLTSPASNVTFAAGSAPIAGFTSASFNGTSSRISMDPANLTPLFNGAAGTVLFFVKLSDAQWTEVATRIFLQIGVDADNRIWIEKAGSPAYRVNWNRRAGGVTKSVSVTLGSGVVDQWIALALTWDEGADTVTAWSQAVQQGAVQTGLTPWAGGTLSGNFSAIGGFRYLLTAASTMSGQGAICGVWPRKLAPAELSLVSNQPP